MNDELDDVDRHADACADPRVRALVHEYAAVNAARFERVAPDLCRLVVADADAHHFDGRREWLLAFSVAALEQQPDAEMAVIGSAFVDRLIAAIRTSGQHGYGGRLPATASGAPAPPDFAIVNAVIVGAQRTAGGHRLARLVARIKLSAGASVHESIVESDIVDLTAGAPAPADVAAICVARARDEGRPPATVERPSGAVAGTPDHASASVAAAAVARRIDARAGLDDGPSRHNIELFRPGLERQVAPAIQRMRDDAARALHQELQRIDGFYRALLAELQTAHGAGSVALQAAQRDHQRRREEEHRRHALRIAVAPIQLISFDVQAERCTWTLRTDAAITAPLHAHRLLAGDAAWRVTCQLCGNPAHGIVVCKRAHVVCDRCASRCSVCRQWFCSTHGLAACHVDGAAVCASHGATCSSCDRPHCQTHTGRCDAGHDACTSCIAACALCGRAVCEEHTIRTHERAPLGMRRLCDRCRVLCEGGSSEPVGRDEASPCATCGRWICRNHQVACEVDGSMHCSTHLRRSDYSRRFLCPAHQTRCDREPGAIVATNEVELCATCGCAICPDHGNACTGCSGRHCIEHLEPLEDAPGRFACAAHREQCHTDGRAWSPGRTRPCATCAHDNCPAHLLACTWCGAAVCFPDIDAPSNRCLTCTRIAPASDVADALIAAAVRLTRGRRARGWAIASDASRHVVQVDLGWTRRIVLSVPHGTAEAAAAMAHSVLTHLRLR